MLNKLKKVTNASKNVINFLNKHITQIIKGNKVHTQNEINNTVTHDNIKKAHVKSAIPITKVHIENNTASNTSKKAHKKLFKNVLKQIKSVNKVHKQDNVFDYDKCKKLHKELFNKVLIELLSTKNARHKDSSANINKAYANDAKCETGNANSLLHNHILYYFNKIKKIEKALSDHSKYILTSLNKKFSDNTVKLSEFKKVNDKLNLLLKGVCFFMFN